MARNIFSGFPIKQLAIRSAFLGQPEKRGIDRSVLPGLVPSKNQDINDSHTVLYLPFENSARDYSKGASEVHTPGISGVTFSSSVKKVGNYSAYFNGAAYLIYPDSVDWHFGSNDFAVRTRVSRLSSGVAVIAAQSSGGGGYTTGLYFNASNQLVWCDNATEYIFDNSVVNNGSGWKHVAVKREDGTLSASIDDVVDPVTRTLVTSTDVPYSLAIGRLGEYGYGYFTGYMDALYIDKGIAR